MVFLAVVFQVSAIALLYGSWCKPLRQPRLNAIAGLLLLSALYFWQRAEGLEFGVVFCLCLLPLPAWLLIAASLEQRQLVNPVRARQWRQLQKISVVSNVGKVLVAGPLAFVACFVLATSLSLGVERALALEVATQLVLSLMLLLFFWSLSIYWLMSRVIGWQQVLMLTMIAGGGSLWIYA